MKFNFMKTKTILSLVFLLFTYVIHAQSNEVEIYSADSKLFTVYIDGVKINQTPLSNVKFTSTKTDNLDFKIVLEENATVIEKKGVEMVSKNARISLTNGARAVYQLSQKNGSYVLEQTSLTNRILTNTNGKVID